MMWTGQMSLSHRPAGHMRQHGNIAAEATVLYGGLQEFPFPYCIRQDLVRTLCGLVPVAGLVNLVRFVGPATLCTIRSLGWCLDLVRLDHLQKVLHLAKQAHTIWDPQRLSVSPTTYLLESVGLANRWLVIPPTS